MHGFHSALSWVATTGRCWLSGESCHKLAACSLKWVFLRMARFTGSTHLLAKTHDRLYVCDEGFAKTFPKQLDSCMHEQMCWPRAGNTPTVIPQDIMS